MTLCCDSMTAIEIANNMAQYDRMKHVELDRNYIKDNLDASNIQVPYIESVNQLVDKMTHVVPSGPFY